MPKLAQQFLDAWAAAPKGASARSICISIGASPRAFLGWCASNRTFRMAYQELREQHGTGCAEVADRRPRRTKEELVAGLELFLEQLEAQADAGGPINQASAARAAGIDIGSVFRRRSPGYGSFDEDFARRYFAILGANTIEAEDRAALLATHSASEVDALGDDSKLLNGLVSYLKTAPGSTHVDQARVEHTGTVLHRHRHSHDLVGVAQALGRVADRFDALGPKPDDLDLVYDAEYQLLEANA